MKISNHAYKRAKKRLGLNKSAFENVVEKALEKGYKRGNSKGRLRKWIDSVITHDDNVSAICFSNFLMIYNGRVIITVYTIPTNLGTIDKYFK